MTRIRCHVKKGDAVEVIAGKDKGSSGKVLEVLPETQRAFVEGINFIKKHTKPTQDAPEGGIVEKESPIHVSNLRVVSKESE